MYILFVSSTKLGTVATFYICHMSFRYDNHFLQSYKPVSILKTNCVIKCYELGGHAITKSYPGSRRSMQSLYNQRAFLHPSTWLCTFYTRRDNLLVRAPDSWSKDCEFKSRQERRENFLLQSQLCVLTLLRCPFRPRVNAVARKRPRSFCQKCRWQVIPKHACTFDPTKSEWADIAAVQA